MGVKELLRRRRDDIIRVAAEHGAHDIRLFGSVVRDEAEAQSDIDLLVDLEPGRSLLDHVALIQDLEQILGRRVDVVTERGLHWYIRDRVVEEAVRL